ncbi:restriction endonuclease [Streptomyces sp. NPDC051921]|uniref:restriction endonuclease n=1 Tax=Streptomyces sp. NPDC051921 TaxID=3155806 RepID=UPI003420F145
MKDPVVPHVIPGMEGGEEGLRSRLEELRDKLSRVSSTLQRHTGSMSGVHGEPVLVLRRVEAERTMLSEVLACHDILNRVHGDLGDALAELCDLDMRSLRRREGAALLYEQMMGADFRITAEWDILGEIQQTFEYASSPLLRAGDGRYFGPTEVFLARFAEHTTAVRSLYSQVLNRCEVLWGFANEALEGPVLKPPAGMDMTVVDALHHSEFEKLIGALLDRDGYRIIRSGGGAGDMGADVLAADPLGRYVMVQAKHFTGGTGSVGQPVAQHLYGGAMATHPSTLPVIVTNGKITGGAKVWADEGQRVRLIGREELWRWSENLEPLENVLKGTGPA